MTSFIEGMINDLQRENGEKDAQIIEYLEKISDLERQLKDSKSKIVSLEQDDLEARILMIGKFQEYEKLEMAYGDAQEIIANVLVSVHFIQ